MKNLKNISIFTLAAYSILLLSSCTDTTDEFVVSETEPVTLSELTIKDIELDPINTNNPAVTFNWTQADYGQQASVNYSLEVSADQSFSNAVIPATVNGNNTITLSVSELNSVAGDAGLNPFEWAPLYARVVSNLGTQNGLPVNSNAISFNVYPYFNYPYKDLYFVGPACASGWNNNNNNPALFRSASNSNEYTYTGYFNADQLKILEMRGAWAPQYGEDNGKLAYRPTEAEPDPSPIDDITVSGYYKFTANVSTLEFSLAPFDGSVPSLSSLAITGSATPSETALQQYGVSGTVFDEHIWYISNVHLVPGELLFKANGSDSWGGETSFSGIATAGGNAISVIVEDDYEVWFNDLTKNYIMIPLNL